MSGSDDFVALEDWELLGRDRAIEAIDAARGFIANGFYRQAEKVLNALSNRLEVDGAVDAYFEAHRKAHLDGKDCHALHN